MGKLLDPRTVEYCYLSSMEIDPVEKCINRDGLEVTEYYQVSVWLKFELKDSEKKLIRMYEHKLIIVSNLETMPTSVQALNYVSDSTTLILTTIAQVKEDKAGYVSQ